MQLFFLAARHVFPSQGSNLQPLCWNCGVLTTGHQGSPWNHAAFVFGDNEGTFPAPSPDCAWPGTLPS